MTIIEQPKLSEAAENSMRIPRPSIRLFDAITLIVGLVVGAEIFETPALVAANANSETAVLQAWGLGGAISIIGALCYAELATTYPNIGGSYDYLKRAFGQSIAILFAWARLSVIQTGSIALLAFVFGDYATQLLRLGTFSAGIYAALAIALLTALNILGVKHSIRDPDRPRPFRVTLCPILLLLFCAACGYLLYSSLVFTGTGAIVGVVVVALGFPLSSGIASSKIADVAKQVCINIC